VHQPLEVLGAMITPAVLISAAALILLSTVNRLIRVNDRLQNLLARAEEFASSSHANPGIASRKEICLRQLANLQERLILFRSAVTALYATIALFVLTSILIGVQVQFPRMSSLLPIASGMLGAVAFLFSIALLIREALIATRVSLQEIDYVEELLQRETNWVVHHPLVAS
jgi:hypothetical protein